jgi:nucleotide-binding universal stress UspA family protein
MAAPVLVSAAVPRLERILFGTDLSEESLQVLPFASGIARAYGSKLYLCHIQADVPLSAGLAAQLAALRSRTPLKDLDVKLILASGKIQDEMPRVIRDNHIDLFVSGTRGRTGLSKMLLGSVVEEICRVVTCPILTVGQGISIRTEESFRNILFATNLSDMSKKALPYIEILAKKFKSRLTILHVMPEDRASAAGSESVTESMRETMKAAFLPALAQYLPEFAVAFGNTAESVLRVAREKQAGLIALGIRNAFRPGILRERTAYRIMAGAHCPVLTVP